MGVNFDFLPAWHPGPFTEEIRQAPVPVHGRRTEFG